MPYITGGRRYGSTRWKACTEALFYSRREPFNGNVYSRTSASIILSPSAGSTGRETSIRNITEMLVSPVTVDGVPEGLAWSQPSTDSACDLESRALRALSHTGLYGHMGEGVNVTVAAVTGRNWHYNNGGCNVNEGRTLVRCRFHKDNFRHLSRVRDILLPGGFRS